MKALARKSALNARAREGDLLVVDQLTLPAFKTREVLALLDRLGATDRKALLLTAGQNPELYRSARNLGHVHVMPYAEASTYHILWSDVVVVERAALDALTAADEQDSTGAGTGAEA